MPRALILPPQRRSIVSSMPITTSPAGKKTSSTWARSLRATARPFQRARLSTSWYRAKPGLAASPMTRSASLTVRLPGASTAPATRTRTCFQTGAVKQSRKADNQVARTGGASAGPAAAGERCVVIASVESSRTRSARVLDRSPPTHTDAAAQPTRRREEFAEKPIVRHGHQHHLRSSRCPRPIKLRKVELSSTLAIFSVGLPSGNVCKSIPCQLGHRVVAFSRTLNDNHDSPKAQEVNAKPLFLLGLARRRNGQSRAKST